jgi:hypothetical protein
MSYYIDKEVKFLKLDFLINVYLLKTFLDMPVNQKYLQDFIEGNYMHIICKSVSNTPLFITDDNMNMVI